MRFLKEKHCPITLTNQIELTPEDTLNLLKKYFKKYSILLRKPNEELNFLNKYSCEEMTKEIIISRHSYLKHRKRVIYHFWGVFAFKDEFYKSKEVENMVIEIFKNKLDYFLKVEEVKEYVYNNDVYDWIYSYHTIDTVL
jgi:hypothetical protein